MTEHGSLRQSPIAKAPKNSVGLPHDKKSEGAKPPLIVQVTTYATSKHTHLTMAATLIETSIVKVDALGRI
jgi:hypothetical protein